MAIYHLSVKAISRSSGRSSTASAAYRSASYIVDQRTGEIHDYSRKKGVLSAEVVLPDNAPAWASDRSALWNAAEVSEKRKDACVAREVVLALPEELSAEERKRLAHDFAKEMANKEGCAVDVALHAPSKKGDDRNYHAHLMRTTRKVGEEGLTDKLDTEKAGRKRSDDLLVLRERWEVLTNERLLENGIDTRIDHRTLKDQGIDREPTVHLGVAVTGMVRRGVSSHVYDRIQKEVEVRLKEAQERGIKERQEAKLDASIIMLSTDINAAKAERMELKMAMFEEKADALIFVQDKQAEQERQRQAQEERRIAEQRLREQKQEQERIAAAQEKERLQKEKEKAQSKKIDRGYSHGM